MERYETVFFQNIRYLLETMATRSKSDAGFARPASPRPRTPTLPHTSRQLLNRDEIARLAYHLWQARGCPNGSSEIDWLQAEQELRSQIADKQKEEPAKPTVFRKSAGTTRSGRVARGNRASVG